MPIVRSYMCPDCAHYIEVTLTLDQADEGPPPCERCAARMNQEFKPVAIGGSNRAKAEKTVEDIIENDYHVGDIQRDRRDESTPKVRYKDEPTPTERATWGPPRNVPHHVNLQSAMVGGRELRRTVGSGLDVLQSNLKAGVQPDLIEISKKRAARVW